MDGARASKPLGPYYLVDEPLTRLLILLLYILVRHYGLAFQHPLTLFLLSHPLGLRGIKEVPAIHELITEDSHPRATD